MMLRAPSTANTMNQQHYRGEQLADAAGAVFLDNEQQGQHQNRERDV